MTRPRTLDPPESRGLSPEELRVYDHLWIWFCHTYLGQGPYVVRPLIKLEQALGLMRRAHRHHYPSRPAIPEHQLALAGCAKVLQQEEPFRVDAEWRGERATAVPVGLWAELGAGRRVAIELAVIGETGGGRGHRTLLLDVDETYGLVKQLLGAVGHARRHETTGMRSDTVFVDRAASTVLLEFDDEDDER